MRKFTLHAVTLALLPIAILAGCNGAHTSVVPQTTVQATPGTLRQKKDISPSDMHAGGGAFPMLAYSGDQQPAGSASNINQLQPTTNSVFFNYPDVNANIYYCETGSDFGKGVFEGTNTPGSTAPCAPLGQPPTGLGGRVDPPDFVGTDAAFSASDQTAYNANRAVSQGNPSEMPTLAGPIVFGYNSGDLSGLNGKQLKLSRWSYCAIANGTVTDWNDPAVTADNGTSITGGSSLPITFYFRSDADGSNLTFQRHLATICSTWAAPYNTAPYESSGRTAVWTGGAPSETWTGPTTGNFVGESGPDAQIQAITSKSGATGAVDGPIAVSQGLSAASLQNHAGYVQATSGGMKLSFFANPTNLSALQKALNGIYVAPGASDAGPVGTQSPKCIAYVPYQQYVDPAAAGAYPIIEVSYILAYEKNNAHLTDLQTLLTYINTYSGPTPAAGTSDSFVEQLGYVPMTAGVKSYVKNYLLSAKNHPCIHS